MAKSDEDKARHAIVKYALKWVGWGNGTGYPGKTGNPACAYMGLGTTYSCACGVSMNFGKAGYPLISMQPGYKTGYTYCPSGFAAAKNHKAIVPSWKCQPADILFIDTSHEHPGHTELVVKVGGSGASRWVESIGWDSGPSNVANGGGTGQGGVHLHRWATPVGKGNSLIYAAADASKLADLGSKTPHKPASKAPTPTVKDEHSQVTLTGLTHPQRHWIRALIAQFRGKKAK